MVVLWCEGMGEDNVVRMIVMVMLERGECGGGGGGKGDYNGRVEL